MMNCDLQKVKLCALTLFACIAIAMVAGDASGGDCEPGWRPVFKDVVVDPPLPHCACDFDDVDEQELVSIPTMYAGAATTTATDANVNRVFVNDVALRSDQDLIVHVFAHDVAGGSVTAASAVTFATWGSQDLAVIPGALVEVRESSSNPFRHSVWRLPADSHSGGVETLTIGFMATSSVRKIVAAIPVTRQHADMIGAVSVSSADVSEGESLATSITTLHEGSLVLACNVQRLGLSHTAPDEAYELYARNWGLFQRISGQTVERPTPGEYTYEFTPSGEGAQTASTILIELRGVVGQHFTKCWEMRTTGDMSLHGAATFFSGAAQQPVVEIAPDMVQAMKLVVTDTDGHSEFKYNLGQRVGRYFIGFDFHTPIASLDPGINTSYWQFVRYGLGLPAGSNHNDLLMTFLRNQGCQMQFHTNEIISNTSPNPLMFDQTQRIVVEIQPNVPARTVLRVWIDGELIGERLGTSWSFDATDNHTFSIRARTNDEMRAITHYVRRVVASTSFLQAAHWEEPPGASVDDAVLALAIHDAGDGAADSLYAGGLFGMAGGEPVGGVARWSGAHWSSLGAGMDGPVYALGVFNHDERGAASLFAGGAFTTAGDASAAGVARWDGASWSALGAGVDGVVHALAAFDEGSGGAGGGPALYVGGDFTTAGGVSAASIACWNGSHWQAFGGVDGKVHAMVVHDDATGSGPALFVAGDFSTAGGVAANGVAKWDGQSWTALGGGVDGEALALAVFDDGSGSALYIGGDFSNAGGVAANGVARWNGVGWSALGAGVNGAVESLAVFDDGCSNLLIAGGDFTTAGGMAAASIARWDGMSWSPLGDGMDDAVVALASFNTDGAALAPGLYAGGRFTASPAGDSHIAMWAICTDEASPVLGDINGDGVVNVQDLGSLLGSWGFCPAPCAADLTKNCFVGSQDLATLLSNWGATSAP